MVISLGLIVTVFIVSLLLLLYTGDMQGIAFTMYGVLGGLAFALFCRYVGFRIKSRKENHQQHIAAATLFPVFRYDTDRAQMVQDDDLALYTITNFYIIVLWSMLICILSVEFYLVGLLLMCVAISFLTIYVTQSVYSSQWMETSSELDDLNAKDLYACLKLSTLSSMVGTNPPRDEGEVDIALGVESIARLCEESENTESWQTLRSIQCYELGDIVCCRRENIELAACHDELLAKSAAKLQKFNSEITEVDYMDQLNNLELIDKVIEERTLVRKKRFAAFVNQLRLTIKAKRLQKNEQKDLYARTQRSANSLNMVASPALSFIPQNVNYETGTHIELDLVGASIFMPWRWVRVKELYPKNASISVFSSNFAGDLK